MIFEVSVRFALTQGDLVLTVGATSDAGLGILWFSEYAYGRERAAQSGQGHGSCEIDRPSEILFFQRAAARPSQASVLCCRVSESSLTT